MNDPENIPKETLAEIVRRTRGGSRASLFTNRASVHESIQNARSTLIINLVIELISGLILLAGLGYAVKFMLANAERLEPGQLPAYLAILAFFSVGWFTYVWFRVRRKYRAFKNYGSRNPDDQDEE